MVRDKGAITKQEMYLKQGYLDATPPIDHGIKLRQSERVDIAKLVFHLLLLVLGFTATVAHNLKHLFRWKQEHVKGDKERKGS